MKFMPRTLKGEILLNWDKKSIHVIRGPRRSGKTTLLKNLKKLKGGTYITFENPNEREDFLSDPIRYVKEMGMPLFLDEIQLLGKKGSRLFKWIYDELHDKGLKLILSGSGAFDIRMELVSSLVGRAYFYELLPLSFEEYIIWKEPNLFPVYKEGHEALNSLLEGKKAEFYKSVRLEKLFKDYIIFGGYPEVVLKGDYKELYSIVNSTIEEDIIHYFGLKESLKVWRTIKKLAALSGQLLDLSSLGIDYRTAEHYLSIFRYSYILKELTTFSTNKFLELTKSIKIYFYDLGFRNALLNKFQPYELRDDLGFLTEMFIFRQLLGKEVHYWRTKNKAEIDFILLNKGKPIPIEVKSGFGRKTKSLYSFIKKYSPSVAIVVGSEVSLLKKNIPIYTIPPYYF